MSYRWRVRVEHHWNFAADQLNVWIAQRNDLGEVSMVEEIHYGGSEVDPQGPRITMGEPLSDFGTPTPPTFTVSRELIEALFEALAPVMIGTDSANILQKVRDLTRERDQANQRVDALINGMGRCVHPQDRA